MASIWDTHCNLAVRVFLAISSQNTKIANEIAVPKFIYIEILVLTGHQLFFSFRARSTKWNREFRPCYRCAFLGQTQSISFFKFCVTVSPHVSQELTDFTFVGRMRALLASLIGTFASNTPTAVAVGRSRASLLHSNSR